MSETPKPSTVYAAITAVMASVGAVGKSRKNLQGGGYQYRGIDDVMAAVQPCMAEHGLVCVPRVVEREREHITTNKGSGMVSVRLLVEHTFYGPDGTSVVCTTIGEAFDSGDKASNKAMAVALKYALTETLMIPTYEADRDTEEHSPEISPPPPRQQPSGDSMAAQRRREAQGHAGDGPRGQAVRADGRVSQGDASAGETGDASPEAEALKLTTRAAQAKDHAELDDTIRSILKLPKECQGAAVAAARARRGSLGPRPTKTESAA